ncbi:hypothetical protein K501DRAFT_260099 [Backusella circina FSU 941]|nr:hypothetical protein K501DRAFT_260099 [Backusella circina FSU 941]
MGAGVPICRNKNACRHQYCRILAQPCPRECPFDCQYSSTSCCAFASKPTCKPACLNIQACVVTPCPSECVNRCYYPNADYCCPKSGQPVCKKPW